MNHLMMRHNDVNVAGVNKWFSSDLKPDLNFNN